MLPPNHFLRPLEAVGTGRAQKCRGSGAPNPNRHPNQPLYHAVCVAAIVFDVVAKACIVAINFLNFCRIGNAIDVAFVVGVFGVGCVTGEGRIYTWSVEGASGSGHLVAWAVAVGFKFMGIG